MPMQREIAPDRAEFFRKLSDMCRDEWFRRVGVLGEGPESRVRAACDLAAELFVVAGRAAAAALELMDGDDYDEATAKVGISLFDNFKHTLCELIQDL
jgi:hypothetical protein